MEDTSSYFDDVVWPQVELRIAAISSKNFIYQMTGDQAVVKIKSFLKQSSD